MPRRRRAREANRKMRRAVEAAEERDRQEFLTAVQSGRAHHLADPFWNEHERGYHCCLDCSPNHPDHLLDAALDEIAWFKEEYA